MLSWTDKRVERLKLLYKEGFPASAIAKKLGPEFTKGMVAGKIRRLGLTTKPATNRKQAKAKPAAAPKPALLGRPTPRPSSTPRSAPAPVTVPPAMSLRPRPEGV